MGNSNFEKELSAVSKLVFDCANLVETDFCAKQSCNSGAFTKDALNVFMYNFGFDVNADYKKKWYYSSSKWKSFIKNDLNNDQPIMYRGEGSAGHAFICDGYKTINEADFFHFNWGWYYSENLYDEWFTLDKLNPLGNDYSNKQAGIFNLKPDPSFYVDYCDVELHLHNLYYAYYSIGGTKMPWEIIPTTMQTLWSSAANFPEYWRTIPSGVSAEYIAHERIVLQSGFRAENGSYFAARIEPCYNCDNKGDSMTEQVLFLHDKTNSMEALPEKNFSYHEKHLLSVNVYPNPSSGIFYIEMKGSTSSENFLEIVNLMGTVVYSQFSLIDGLIVVDLSSYQKGIYFVKLSCGEIIHTEKIVYR